MLGQTDYNNAFEPGEKVNSPTFKLKSGHGIDRIILCVTYVSLLYVNTNINY